MRLEFILNDHDEVNRCYVKHFVVNVKCKFSSCILLLILILDCNRTDSWCTCRARSDIRRLTGAGLVDRQFDQFNYWTLQGSCRRAQRHNSG